ncbi:unnamed protein product [Larinioides sclopetarius]|uniref:Serpin domain-containing protein n=1 Tax=Larinioides sclopetarius TaxID=280406 RepID=A0AAV2BPL9_9ARAC
MKSINVFSAIFAFWLSVTSAGGISSREDIYSGNIRKLTFANNDLAFNLYRKFVSGSSENVFFSPLSISTVFGMLFYGTRGNTAEELRQVLGYEGTDLSSDLVHNTFSRYLRDILQHEESLDGNVLNVANAVLVDKLAELPEEYRRNVQELYRASVRDVDFMTESLRIVEEINDYVRENTNGKIDKLFDELDPSTVLVFLNAVYLYAREYGRLNSIRKTQWMELFTTMGWNRKESKRNYWCNYKFKIFDEKAI